MSATTVTTTVPTPTESQTRLTLRPSPDDQKKENSTAAATESYRYSHLLPHFSHDRYPPLTPFDHIDPGFRALTHQNPRAFLESATSVIELTPNLGTEVHGVQLTQLDSNARDQLALEVQ